MTIHYDFIKPINDNTITQFQDTITTISQNEPIEHLILNMSSLGGSVTSAITSYNFLKKLPFTITTHNLGEVTSAAIILYLAGNIRTAEKISKFVMHPIKGIVNGELSYYQLQELVQLLEADIKNYSLVVNQETNYLNGIYNIEDCLKGKSITLHPKEAFQCGLITKMFD